MSLLAGACAFILLMSFIYFPQFVSPSIESIGEGGGKGRFVNTSFHLLHNLSKKVVKI